MRANARECVRARVCVCVCPCVCVCVGARAYAHHLYISTLAKMEGAWAELKQSVSLANRLNKSDEELVEFRAELKTALDSAVTRCRAERKRKLSEAPELDLSDESMRQAARFTDNLPLADYARVLNLVPRLVNVVTCVRARTLRAHARARGSWPRASHSPVAKSGVAQVGRGRARARKRTHAASEPAQDRCAVHECLLRSEALCCGPARIQQPALPRADLP